MLFPIFGPSSLPVVVAHPDNKLANRTALCWSGMTDTEHTTSGSNEEGQLCQKLIKGTKP